MKTKRDISQDSLAKSAIAIEWDGELFGYWCMRCREITECHRQLENLRCCKCGYKMGEKLDADYARMLREGERRGVH